jgi:hypothetical protein
VLPVVNPDMIVPSPEVEVVFGVAGYDAPFFK